VSCNNEILYNENFISEKINQYRDMLNYIKISIRVLIDDN